MRTIFLGLVTPCNSEAKKVTLQNSAELTATEDSIEDNEKMRRLSNAPRG